MGRSHQSQAPKMKQGKDFLPALQCAGIALAAQKKPVNDAVNDGEVFLRKFE